MINQELADRLYKVLFECHKNRNKPDLHSFMIKTTKGEAFVDCRESEVLIVNNGTKWVGSIVAGANRLALMGADLQTLDI